jgi:predicted dithiol-disulfide oxidoreductase (DUF899 family)
VAKYRNGMMKAMQNNVVDREEWVRHRAELLMLEKAHTKERDRLSQLRRQLPWVKVDKNYSFELDEAEVSLVSLFGNNSQLIVYHLMFGEEWDRPCLGCTKWAEALNGTVSQYKNADATVLAISSASQSRVKMEQAKRGWTFPWVSAVNTDFSHDYYGSADKGTKTKSTGTEGVHFDRGENHGISVFYKNEAGEVFHTYSCYNRGVESMNGTMAYLDILPKGRTW